MELDRPSTARPPIWRRPAVLATAAAIAVVALIAGVGLATQDDDQVETDPAEDGGLPAPTGWYVPPEGWDIAEVRTDFLDVGASGACPCRTLIAAEDGEQPVALVVRETAGPMEGLDGAVPIDVGGRPGQIADVRVQRAGGGLRRAPPGPHLRRCRPRWPSSPWPTRGSTGGRRARPSSPPTCRCPTPWSPASSSTCRRDGASTSSTSWRWSGPPDAGPTTRSSLAGAFYSALVIGADRVTPRDGRFEVLATVGISPMAGLVGGPVDLVVGPSYFADEGDDLTVDELRAFLGGLREVSTDDWRAAIEGRSSSPPTEATSSSTPRSWRPRPSSARRLVDG